MRIQLLDAFGVERVGPQPFPLFVDDAESQREFEQRRSESRHADGTVRWSQDDEIDARMRIMLAGFVLDPDADLRQPCGEPYRGL